jgi:hypothetical protein
MRPLAVFLGIVMGSSVSIALCLAMTLIVFLAIPEFAERIGDEFPPLVRTLVGSSLLAVVAAASFYAELRSTRWRRGLHLLLAIALGVVVLVAWPRG